MAGEEFDVVVVGGGTAGAVVAARLSEDPGRRVALIEAGPSDLDYDEVLKLRRWLELLEGPLDYGYRTTLQPNGNSHIVHSRAQVLGGCSSHNTMIWFKAHPRDWSDWERAGAAGWGPEAMAPYYDRLQNPHQLVAAKDRNAILFDWVESAAAAAGVPANPDWNAAPFRDGAGFLDVGYTPATGVRSSSSVAYLHPIMGRRDNLTLMLETRALRVEIAGGRATGVTVAGADGQTRLVHATGEVVVCAGAVDSPRLLLMSGIGPAQALTDLAIEVVHDLPGVGENLIDHPESIILWELVRPLGPETTMHADCALFVNRLGEDERPDLMYHTYQIPFTFNTERLGYPVPDNAMCMTPNITRARSRGRMWLLSKNPDVKPALDFRYFSDEGGYDATTIVDGLKIAREVAANGPFKSWLKREIAPGPGLKSDEELSRYGRAVHHTVYHPAGTCRMGAAADTMAVVEPNLRVRGLEGLRVADASVFPLMPTVNPMVTVLMIGEKAAEMIGADQG
ncbi:MAG: GMC family oxidoreductase N-terminal domain-containing protein [Candidatus Dormibacteraeota bacterium]|nr:GMC family oxidoreductase N-terminal domain-containing protein [Candidatus Dormibacteraeota bacterium]